MALSYQRLSDSQPGAHLATLALALFRFPRTLATPALAFRFFPESDRGVEARDVIDA